MLGRCSSFGLRFSLVGVIFSCLEFFFIVIYQNYVQATLFVHIELRLSFRTADELHCKKTLIFSICVELRLSFCTANELHCKKKLIIGACVELGYIFHSALPMRCIAKNLLYFALLLNYVFHSALPMNCIAKHCTSYIWRLC